MRSLDHSVPYVSRPHITRRIKGRVLSPSVNNQGYLTLTLAGRNVKLHTIVATAFHGARPEGQEVRHLDGDPTNNAASNLKWGTHAENVRDQVEHGTHYQANVTHCPQGHPYDDTNTRFSTDGRRHCRACQRDHSRAHRERRVLTRLANLTKESS